MAKLPAEIVWRTLAMAAKFCGPASKRLRPRRSPVEREKPFMHRGLSPRQRKHARRPNADMIVPVFPLTFQTTSLLSGRDPDPLKAPAQPWPSTATVIMGILRTGRKITQSVSSGILGIGLSVGKAQFTAGGRGIGVIGKYFRDRPKCRVRQLAIRCVAAHRIIYRLALEIGQDI